MLWSIIPHLVLLLLVMAYCFHLTLLLFVMVCCPLPCTETIYYGVTTLALHCCCLLWFIALAVCCCYFFVVVYHPSPCDVIVCYNALPLWILGHEVSCVIFEIKIGFFSSFKSFVVLYSFCMFFLCWCFKLYLT